MKKHTTGFVPAHRINYAFVQQCIDDLREQCIDKLVAQAIDNHLSGISVNAVKATIKLIRNKSLVFTGTTQSGFVVRHFKGEYQIKKDPRIVYAICDPYDYNDKTFLFAYPILRQITKPADDMAESFTNDEIHYTIKIPKHPNGKAEAIDLIREYNASRRNTTDFDCSGVECGHCTVLSQTKKGELSLIDHIQYDY